ncbi:MAG TPA: hypothetical protein DCG51_08730 [Erysipelotrichaceae bacterium]|jgi:hypothetical protein|nr:hypothetical protein [Erysipelotrichaceae bacterium]
MKYYGFYSADEDLPDDYTDQYTLFLDSYYRGFIAVFENRTTHAIRIKNGNHIKTLGLSQNELSAVEKKVYPSQLNDEIHYRLLLRIADHTGAESTIIFRSILDLGTHEQYADKTYRELVKKGLHLKFVNGAVLNSDNFYSDGMIDPATERLMGRLIRSALQEADEKQKLPARLTDLTNAEKKRKPYILSAKEKELW